MSSQLHQKTEMCWNIYDSQNKLNQSECRNKKTKKCANEVLTPCTLNPQRMPRTKMSSWTQKCLTPFVGNCAIFHQLICSLGQKMPNCPDFTLPVTDRRPVAQTLLYTIGRSKYHTLTPPGLSYPRSCQKLLPTGVNLCLFFQNGLMRHGTNWHVHLRIVP